MTMGYHEGSSCRPDWATAAVDPLLPFLVGPGTGAMRQERPFRKQAADASVRPKADHIGDVVEEADGGLMG